MLITDRFVFVHLPKTGGTFVADAMSFLYGGFKYGRAVDFAVKRPPPGEPFCFRNQFKHLSRRRIPEPFRHLPVLGTIRNPYSRYVSQYRFGTWKVASKDFPPLAAHPDFPNVPFRDYVRLANEHLWLVASADFYRARSIGWQTASVIQWYGFPDLLDSITSSTPFTAEAFRGLLDPVRLLRMEHLREDLYQALMSLGYERDKVEFIHQLPRIYPDPVNGDAAAKPPAAQPGVEGGPFAVARSYTNMPVPDAPPWQDYYDDELKSYVRDRERLLFAMFPEWDD